MAEAWCTTGSAVDDAALNAMRHLATCYTTLSSDSIFCKDLLADSASRFATLYCALAKLDPKTWRIKPKLHLLLELSFSGGRPSLCWTYRDEDFGGSVGHFAKRRGAPMTARGFSAAVLKRFRLQPMLRSVKKLQTHKNNIGGIAS